MELRRPWTRIPLFQRVVLELQSHCNRDCYFCCRESDTAGKRKTADGSAVRASLPTEKVLGLLDECIQALLPERVFDTRGCSSP